MDNSDKKRFWNCMKAMLLNAGYEQIEDPELSRLYFAAMSDFTIEQVETGFITAMRSWKSSKPIPIGVIIEKIEAVNKPPSIEDKALVAANEIISHLKRFGSSQYPNFENDPIAKHLMTARWPYRQWASQILESELKWWVKEFCEAYRAYISVSGDVPQIGFVSDEARSLLGGIGKDMPRPNLKAITGGASR